MTEHDAQTRSDGNAPVRRPRRAPGWPAAAVVGAVVVVVLAVIFAAGGAGWFADSPGSPPEASSPGLLPQGDYQAKDQQQAGKCDGAPAVSPTDLRLLDPDAKVAAAVVCTDDYADLPGKGRWLVRLVTDVPQATLPGLVAALTAADVSSPNSGACDSSLHIVQDFVLTLADGSRIRPGVPGDGCHASSAVASALQAAAGPVRTTVPVSQIASEQQVTSGCGPEAKSPAVWLSADRGMPPNRSPAPSDSEEGETSAAARGSVSTQPPAPASASLPASGSVTVCRYAFGDDPMLGTLEATGDVPVDAVADMLGTLNAKAAVGCPSPATPERSPATDWLMIQQLPTTGTDQPAPLLLIELDGCRRVIGGPAMAVFGYLPTAAAENLSALADRPAR